MRLLPANRRQWLWAAFRLGLILIVTGCAVRYSISMPGTSHRGALPPLSAEEKAIAHGLETHIRILASDIGQRNIWTLGSMERSAAYITKTFTDLGYQVAGQPYITHGKEAANLEVAIKGHKNPEETIVVGAHYDTVLNCPGANDNGSGVAALLELARLLRDSKPARTIRLVAFANEEPPFYYGNDMGSRQYARQCRERKEDIVAMLALETMGFYRDEAGSQRYPFPLSLFYPNRADFIAFVGNIESRGLVRRAIRAFRRQTRFPSEGVAAPGLLVGIGWSDHWSFWQEGYAAIMVTDTAFFRYEAYHTADDTPEKIDHARLARVVGGLSSTISGLAADDTE